MTFEIEAPTGMADAGNTNSLHRNHRGSSPFTASAKPNAATVQHQTVSQGASGADSEAVRQAVRQPDRLTTDRQIDR